MKLAKRNEPYFPSVFDRFSDDDFCIEVAAPGMDKNDFKVNFKNNVLTISSKKKNESKGKNGNLRLSWSLV